MTDFSVRLTPATTGLGVAVLSSGFERETGQALSRGICEGVYTESGLLGRSQFTWSGFAYLGPLEKSATTQRILATALQDGAGQAEFFAAGFVSDDPAVGWEYLRA